tara:strand:+ start:218 stop:460 length:243 start_codon:yes stop_codon:yes gene_type:complete
MARIRLAIFVAFEEEVLEQLGRMSIVSERTGKWLSDHTSSTGFLHEGRELWIDHQFWGCPELVETQIHRPKDGAYGGKGR